MKSEADIRRYMKSGKAKRDITRLREHVRKHGGEPSAEDLKEIPPLTQADLARMYRPVKQSIHVRVDADVIAWLKSKGGAYQTRLNDILRGAMLSER